MPNIIIAGDFAFRPEANSLEEDSFETNFGSIKSILSKSDYSILNMESPIIYGTPTPINKTGPNLYAHPKAFQLIKFLGFNSVTLANNHFFDQGAQGVNDTINECKKLGIEYFGGGSNITEASQTKYVNINGKKIAIINCCEIEYSIASNVHGGSNPLDPITQYYKIKKAKQESDFVIVIAHGGIEHFQYPTIKMQEIYRFFIDCGADAVVNHHQHCYSGFEIYNGSPIVYGLGNFFFPRVKYSKTFWNFGYMIRLIFKEKVELELIPYDQCSGNISIQLLQFDDLKRFNQNLKDLNHVISNKEALQKVNEEFLEQSLNMYDWIFQPYKNKYLKALANRGFFPKLLSLNRIDRVMSLINCQSHYYRFNYYLHKHTTKDI